MDLKLLLLRRTSLATSTVQGLPLTRNSLPLWNHKVHNCVQKGLQETLPRATWLYTFTPNFFKSSILLLGSICAYVFSHDVFVPNVVVGCLTLLPYIREVPGSDLSPETGYPDWDFSWFSAVPPGKCRDSTFKLGHDRFLPHSFQFIIHFTYDPFVRRNMVRVTEKAPLNKLQNK
jgi:hypothetical protein